MTVYYGRSASQFLNDGAFAGVRVDGSVVAWGNPETGGELGEAAAALDGSVEVVEITSNAGAFAALLADGSVVAWGDDLRGGDTSAVAGALAGDDGQRVTQVIGLGTSNGVGTPASQGFAAMREDGSVVTWGASADEDETTPAGAVFSFDPGDELSSAVQITASAENAFSIFDNSFTVLGRDGSISLSQNYNLFSVLESGNDDQAQAVRLYEYAPNYALFSDGAVYSIYDLSNNGSEASPLTDVLNPIDVVSDAFETAVLGSDGSVVTFDGDRSNPILRVPATQQATELYATGNAFAALSSDGSVETWSGIDRAEGWNLEEAVGFEQFNAALNGEDGLRVIDIVPGSSGFSALREDGSVVTWEISNNERDVFDTTDDEPVVDFSIHGLSNDSIEKIVASGDRFMGLSESGEVFTWAPGSEIIPARQVAFVEEMGGIDSFDIGGDRDTFEPVVDIFASGDTEFSVLRADGDVVQVSTFSGESSTAATGIDFAHSAYDGLSIGNVLDDGGTPVSLEPPTGPEEPDTPSALYQPSTEDLEIAARLVAYQRLGEDSEDYHSFGNASAFITTYVSEQDYEFEVLSQGSPNAGFFAVGMTSPTAEPILAIRGSSNADDWATNFEPEGSGRSQVDDSWDDIVDWIARSTSEGQALNITGHSQGGAQTQYIASRLTSEEEDVLNDLSLGTLATFNSPGIARVDADQFDGSGVRDVTHFVSSGDIVSLSGEAFIDGTVDYSIFDKGYSEENDRSVIEYVESAHTGHWLQASLNEEIGAVFTFQGDDFVDLISPRQNITKIEGFNSSDDISASDFSYLSATAGNYDAEYDQWLEDVDTKLGYTSILYPALSDSVDALTAGSVVTPLASTFLRANELVSEGIELGDQIGEISRLIPENGVLVNRGATEEFRINYGNNFERILKLIDPVEQGGEGGAVLENVTTPAILVSDGEGGTVASEAPGSLFDVGFGLDRVEVSGGGNVIFGIPEELNNDTISGFQETDVTLSFLSEFVIDQVRLEEGSAILNIDTDGDSVEDTVLTFEGDYDLNGFVVTPFDGGTAITYEPRSDGEPTVPCFTPQSLVMTKRGLVPAGDIREGDLLVTRDHGYQPVNWIGRRALSREELVRRTHLTPILIKRGALGADIPERDMMVSPQHKMLWMSASASVFYGDSEVFVAAKHLTHLPGVETTLADRVVYLHFLFDRHEVVLADGAWSESFNPGQNVLTGMDKDQSTELLELFPDLRGERKTSAFLSARRSLKPHEAQVLL